MKVCIITELDSEQLREARKQFRDSGVNAEFLVEGTNVPNNIHGFIVGVRSSEAPTKEMMDHPNFAGSIGVAIPSNLSGLISQVLSSLEKAHGIPSSALGSENSAVAAAPAEVRPNRVINRITITDAMKTAVVRETGYSFDQVSEFINGKNITDLGMAIRHPELPSEVKSVLERFI